MNGNEIVNHKCPICKKEYTGERWKKICYDCYKEYKYLDGCRIRRLFRSNYDDIYISHPEVTKEEVNEFISKKGLEHGWGANIWTPNDNHKKCKIWVNYTNYD